MKRFWIIAPIALVLSGVAGVFSADLTAKVEHPPAFDRLLKEIPPYPDAYFYPLGEQTRVAGVPREMGWAVTRDPVHKVAERYVGYWESRGQKISRRVSDHEEAVIATSPTDPLVRTVVATKRSDGKTAIIASVSDRTVVVDTTSPAPQSCQVDHSTGSLDRGVKTEVVFYTCDATIIAVTGFYDNRLATAKRNALREPSADKKEAQISYREEKRNVSLLAAQTQADPPITRLTLTWQERP